MSLAASTRGRTAFIPVELYYRDRVVTPEELRQSCEESRKIIQLHWNLGFEAKHKARGVAQWFQHDRRTDQGFPFPAGPAARVYIPKNVHFQVKDRCRLGAVVVTMDAGLDRLPEVAAALQPARSPPPPRQPDPRPQPNSGAALTPYFPSPTAPPADHRLQQPPSPTGCPFPTGPWAYPAPCFPSPIDPMANHYPSIPLPGTYWTSPHGPVPSPNPWYPLPHGPVATLEPAPRFPTGPEGYTAPSSSSRSSASSSL